MDRERVIVYIDENTDDGMMWEELNQNGQMQVSVYDEELEYDVEYSHSIVVKSLQEYLAEHDKQVRKEVCEEIFRDFNRKIDDEFGDNDIKYITLDVEDVNFYLIDLVERIGEEK